MGAEHSERSTDGGARTVRFGDSELEASVRRGIPEAGERIDGPAILELPETTVVVPPRWRAEPDESGAVILEHL